MKLNNRVLVGAIGLSLTTAAMAFGASAPANAKPYDEVKVEVRYGDLDLTSDAGASAMYSRLHRASIEACGGAIEIVAGLGQRGRMRQCRAKALGTAIADLRSPLVTALYSDKTRQTVQLASR